MNATPQEVLIIEHIVPGPIRQTQTMEFEVNGKRYCAVTLDWDTMQNQSPESLARIEWEIWGNCMGHGGDKK